LRGFFYADAKAQELAYRKFLVKYSVGRFNDDIWEFAAKLYSELRKGGWNISDSDILIGAFCIKNNCTLVTTNTKHFKNMANIVLLIGRNNLYSISIFYLPPYSLKAQQRNIPTADTLWLWALSPRQGARTLPLPTADKGKLHRR
jgi:hypothetical protein